MGVPERLRVPQRRWGEACGCVASGADVLDLRRERLSWGASRRQRPSQPVHLPHPGDQGEFKLTPVGVFKLAILGDASLSQRTHFEDNVRGRGGSGRRRVACGSTTVIEPCKRFVASDHVEQVIALGA